MITDEKYLNRAIEITQLPMFARLIYNTISLFDYIEYDKLNKILYSFVDNSTLNINKNLFTEIDIKKNLQKLINKQLIIEVNNMYTLNNSRVVIE